LVHAEQGLGDTIQFYRYVPLLRDRHRKVIFEVSPSLVPLFESQHENITICGSGGALPKFDMQCPLMSLPLAFKTTLQTIPLSIPYLFPGAQKVAAWREVLGEKKKYRIGLAWSGNPAHRDDVRRSIPLDTLAHILTEAAEWHAIQKNIRDRDRDYLIRSNSIKNYSGLLKDFSDTAALISEMDLVIAVDTAAAHLAGALGKRVWILLPFHPDYRWLRDRDDSPWYPTAQLFRQAEDGKWDDVLKRISGELDALHF